jgi:hypothetical protein
MKTVTNGLFDDAEHDDNPQTYRLVGRMTNCISNGIRINWVPGVSVVPPTDTVVAPFGVYTTRSYRESKARIDLRFDCVEVSLII